MTTKKSKATSRSKHDTASTTGKSSPTSTAKEANSPSTAEKVSTTPLAEKASTKGESSSDAQVRKAYPDDVNYIGYGIYVGARRAACNSFLQANKITHVLSIDKQPFEALTNVVHKMFSLKDDATGAEFEKIAKEGCDFIDEGTKDTNKILVHCWMGVSRSILMTVAWLRSRQKISSWTDAFIYVAKKRPQVFLTDNFREFLKKKASEDDSSAPFDFQLPGDKTSLTRERTKKNLKVLDSKKVSHVKRVKDKREGEQTIF